MKRFVLCFLFVAGLIYLPTLPAEAASLSCSFRCMRVRIFPGSICRLGIGTELENVKFYEALAVQNVSLTVPDGTTPAACSAGACLERCRTACGGRRVGERTEESWLNGEQACLNEIPDYMTRISCSSIEGADVSAITLINERTRSTFGSSLVTCAVPTTPTVAPAASTGPGTCVFKCARNGVKSAYSGPRIACSTAADCTSCNDACRDGVSGNPSVCVLQNFTPTPTPDELPKCEMAPAGSPTTLTNPLNTTDIGEIIARFIRALTGIAGSLALLMLVVGGVMWMTAEGSDRVGTAQTIIKNACLGLMLIFLAYSLTSLFLLVLGL